MFKRAEKRRRKKVEEDELGLNEDMKEIFGIHDTDSDESDSDSDQSSAGDVENVQEDLSDRSGFTEGLESDHDEDEEEHVITVQEALRDPVYLVSLQPEVKACIVCPGKFLKGVKMVALHRTSKAHERRFGQFKTTTAGINSKENAWDIIRRNTGGHSKASLTPSENSKRAEKRKAKLAAHQAKRAKQKAKLKAIKATSKSDAASDVLTTHPQETQELMVPQKKRKIDKSAPLPASSKSKALVSNKTHSAIKSIVRSTSERAKLARTRFLKDVQGPPLHENPNK